MNNLQLDGVTNWDFEQLTGNVGIIPPGYTVKYTLSNPKISLDADYDMDIELNGQRIFGNGHVTYV